MKKGAVKTWSTPAVQEEQRLIPCTLCGGREFRPALSCEGFAYVRCTGCGLVQMNPQPLHSEVHKRYREEHGKDYLAYELANEKNFLRLQELALSDAGFTALEGELFAAGIPKILDAGCATGALLEKLRNRGWEVQGVELSLPQADYAGKARNINVRSLPLEESYFNGGEFQVILASHLIEHLNNPGAFVREAYRILSPGGHFFVTTPNIAGFQARLFKGRWRSAIFDHLYLFSVKTLSLLLSQSGFALEKIITWGGLAAGTAPPFLKYWADRGAKKFGFGDVMLIRVKKPR